MTQVKSLFEFREMSDAPVVAKGPKKFGPLKRTAVAFDSKIAPTAASIAEDFSKIAPIAFTGVPPAPLVELAAQPLQQQRLGEMKAVREALEAPAPAAEAKEAEAEAKEDEGVIDLDAVVGTAAPLVAKPTIQMGKPAVTVKPTIRMAKTAGPTIKESAVAPAPAVAAEVSDPAVAELIKHVKEKIDSGTDKITPDIFVPENRRAHKPFIIQTFKKYHLPKASEDPDPETCMKAAKASSKELKTFQYQAFVRDYLQRASPYRGLLVYHGLGSGKTCTSIATAEALYGAGSRKIIIMTPASLSGNFRGEMSKCGYFAFQQENHWSFVEASVRKGGPELAFLTDTLGLPIDWIRKMKGGWVPDPSLPSNWKELDPATQGVINEQIQRHVNSRFQFINYNGLSERKVREWACKTPKMFDGAVIIIDEIHNLIRTINNSNLEHFFKEEPLEPEYTAKYCQTGKKYRIGYLVYRLLCNAVGAKIVGLSGTPIINYPQELGIIANILSGDMRFASATLSATSNKDTVEKYFQMHPEVDISSVVSNGGILSIKLTPVPSGHRKVVTKKGELRGFVRDEDLAAEGSEMRRERDMPAWLGRVEAGLKKLVGGSAGVFENIKFGVDKRLPDIEKPFVDTFVNTETLSLQKPNDTVLTARLAGLISYYKAGKPELVAKVVKDEIVEIEMSDRQLQQYTIVRNAEIKQEEDESKRARKKAPPKKDARYEEVMKSQKGTFKIFSRASCNFVFPDDIPRPRPGDENLAAVELGTAAEDEEGVGGVISEAVQDDVIDAEAVKPTLAEIAAATKEDPYQRAIQAALSSLKATGEEVFKKDSLMIYSPKFQKVLDNLETSKGPALVYSNFKTLEGLGIFGLALEFQKDYMRLDVKQEGGQWNLAPELLEETNLGKKRYITYSGDDDAAKRDLLKHIFNANWAKLPANLVAQVKQINGGSENNIKGEISMLFMITQSGAEGISLENVRQVHIMEPYWNYVRLEQVKGRAIRICSHKSLPPEERTVEVFTYISKFSEGQKTERRVDQTLMIKDGGLTTDQQILSVSDGKRKLADSLASAMKNGAVDCELNNNENGEGIACYRFPEATMDILFNPNLAENITESAAAVREKK